MAQSGTGTANFSKAIDDWLTNDVGEGVMNFQKSTFTEFINKWANTWRQSLETAKHGKYTGHIASGNLYQSLLEGWELTILGKKVNIRLVLPDYYKYTDDKRNPTSGNGNGAVRKALSFQGGKAGGWIAQKKLVPSVGMTFKGTYKLKDGTVKSYTRKLNAAQSNRALSFMIARKIHKKGYDGSNWFSRYLKEFETDLNDFVTKEFGSGNNINLEIFGK